MRACNAFKSSKGDKIEIIINGKADEVIENFFESLLNRHQIEIANISHYSG